VLKDHGCITSASTDLIKRIYKMTDGIAEILNKYNIDKIIVEEVRPEGGYGVGNTKTHRALM
jgi:Holliday junction resolvasome RuvABC endonuclease subunit